LGSDLVPSYIAATVDSGILLDSCYKPDLRSLVADYKSAFIAESDSI